jgi:nitroreductase
MKLKTIFIVCAILAPMSAGAQSKERNRYMENPVIENIMTRTSIRKFKDTPVEKDKIDAILHAGMAAPSAVNSQPWHFVVVTDPHILSKIAQYRSPLAIVVCGDMHKFVSMGKEWWIADTSLASENMLLAAHALGLGGIWTALYPLQEYMMNASVMLHLPDNLIPLNVLIFGYADQNPQPKNKWNPDNVSYNTYGNKP